MSLRPVFVSEHVSHADEPNVSQTSPKPFTPSRLPLEPVHPRNLRVRGDLAALELMHEDLLRANGIGIPHTYLRIRNGDLLAHLFRLRLGLLDIRVPAVALIADHLRLARIPVRGHARELGREV